MPKFTKSIRTAAGNLSFLFNRIYAVEGTRYHISVSKDNKLIIFHMHEESGKWIISNRENCPEWLLQLENELSEIIKKH